MQKYVVFNHSDDGYTYEHRFKGVDGVINYIKEQIGRKLTENEMQCIQLKNYIVIGDDYGRRFELMLRDVDKCPVCKKTRALFRVESAHVCLDCFNGYECGSWSIVNGKIKKAKPEW